MKDEFVTYETALALKELGFNEPCLVYWVFDGKEITFSTSHNKSGWSMIGYKNSQMNKKAGLCIAPLKQQAILFLLNKCDDLHGAELSIEYFGDESGILKNYGGNFTSVSQAIDKLIMLANDKMP